MRPHTAVPRCAGGLLLTGLLSIPAMALAGGPSPSQPDDPRRPPRRPRGLAW